MNYCLIIICCLSLSCFKSNWATTEKQSFMIDCQSAGQTKEYCLCALRCLEINFQTYLDAQNNLEAVSNTTSLNVCSEECKTQ